MSFDLITLKPGEVKITSLVKFKSSAYGQDVLFNVSYSSTEMLIDSASLVYLVVLDKLDMTPLSNVVLRKTDTATYELTFEIRNVVKYKRIGTYEMLLKSLVKLTPNNTISHNRLTEHNNLFSEVSVVVRLDETNDKHRPLIIAMDDMLGDKSNSGEALVLKDSGESDDNDNIKEDASLEKKIEHYAFLNQQTVIDYDHEDKIYVARINGWKGCATHGNTPMEALENLEEVKRMWIQSSIESGYHIPHRFNLKIERTVDEISKWIDDIKKAEKQIDIIIEIPKAESLKREIEAFRAGQNHTLPNTWVKDLMMGDPEYDTYLRLKNKFSLIENKEG